MFEQYVSLPVRERGLKLGREGLICRDFESLPVRERGLKPRHHPVCRVPCHVAPRAGAWIETGYPARHGVASPSRSPCGSVD